MPNIAIHSDMFPNFTSSIFSVSSCAFDIDFRSSCLHLEGFEVDIIQESKQEQQQKNVMMMEKTVLMFRLCIL